MFISTCALCLFNHGDWRSNSKENQRTRGTSVVISASKQQNLFLLLIYILTEKDKRFLFLLVILTLRCERKS